MPSSRVATSPVRADTSPAYADKLDYTKYPGDFTVSTMVNPIAVQHDKVKHYDLPEFPNKIGQTYASQ